MESTMVLKIIIGLIIFLYALRGMRKGFIRTLMSMAFLIMAAVLVYFANPTVSSFLKEKTPVYDVLEDKCGDIFSMKNLSRLSGKKETASEEENDIRTEPTRIEQAKIIDSLALPDLLKTQLAENNNASGYASLAVSGFEGYLAAFMANLVLRAPFLYDNLRAGSSDPEASGNDAGYCGGASPAEGGQSGSRASGGNSPGHLCRLDSLSHHYSYGRYRCRQPDIDSHQSG